jgi:hypothetical protein
VPRRLCSPADHSRKKSPLTGIVNLQDILNLEAVDTGFFSPVRNVHTQLDPVTWQ